MISGRENESDIKDLQQLYTFNEKQLDRTMQNIDKIFEYH